MPGNFFTSSPKALSGDANRKRSLGTFAPLHSPRTRDPPSTNQTACHRGVLQFPFSFATSYTELRLAWSRPLVSQDNGSTAEFHICGSPPVSKDMPHVTPIRLRNRKTTSTLRGRVIAGIQAMKEVAPRTQHFMSSTGYFQ